MLAWRCPAERALRSDLGLPDAAYSCPIKAAQQGISEPTVLQDLKGTSAERELCYRSWHCCCR